MHTYDFRDKKIALLGFGKSNSELLRYIKKFTDNIHVFDQKANTRPSKSEFDDLVFHIGLNCFSKLCGYDYIFRSPAIRPDNEHILNAVKQGALLTSEIELFISSCIGRVIGVTGSDGKTTTASMIYEILRQDGRKVYLGGNIGTPLINLLDDIDNETYVVLELSSFQLMTLNHPVDIAVITNLSPNHLDYHKTYNEYIESKKNLIRYMQKDSVIVLNADNEESIKHFKTKNHNIRLFNSPVCAQYKDGYININNIGVIDTSFLSLRGRHNIDNFMAAILSVIDIVSFDSIINAAKAFRSVEHRMEHVALIKEVEYINDSIASSPTRTIAGLKSFDQKVILIAGGRDKGLDYSIIGKFIKKYVKHLILIGETKDVILKSALFENKELKYTSCDDLRDAVLTGYNISVPGDIVFFSPASTSFDTFDNFEHRGRSFKEYVKKLEEMI